MNSVILYYTLNGTQLITMSGCIIIIECHSRYKIRTHLKRLNYMQIKWRDYHGNVHWCSETVRYQPIPADASSKRTLRMAVTGVGRISEGLWRSNRSRNGRRLASWNTNYQESNICSNQAP